MAVRLSQERLQLVIEDSPPDVVADLPSVRRLAALNAPEESTDQQVAPDLRVVGPDDNDLGGDDDEDGECDAALPGDDAAQIDEDDYYADVWDIR